MKTSKPFIAMGLIAFISFPVLAIATDNEQLEKLTQQVSQLQQEMKTLKSTSKHKVVKSHHKTKKSKSTRVISLPIPLQQIKPVVADENAIINAPPYTLPQYGYRYLPIDLDVPGQAFVSTGPYLGVPWEYSGSDLLINSPSINEDVSLLKLRKNVNTRLSEIGFVHPETHGHLLLSGLVEGQAYVKSSGNGGSTSDVNVTSVKLDAYILGPSSWTSGLISFAYDNDISENAGVITSQHRVSNSRVFVDKAFIVLGDFTKSSFYGTIGQMYVPFGTYSSNMITSPLTKPMARTKARALLVGYQQQGPNAFYASAYVLRGDSYPPTRNNKVNNGGLNVGYRFQQQDKFHSDIGAGVIGNIADSVGMQNTGNDVGSTPLFGGFGSTANTCGPTGTSNCGNEKLVHRVPAYDIRALLSIARHWDLIAEYIIGSTHFNPNDLSMNNHGARPRALNTELAYTFKICDRPVSLSGSYGMTQDALAIGLPAKRYSMVLNTSIWRDTLQSLEFRHDIDYSASNVSSGSGVPGPTGTGQSDNVLTAQFDIYF